MFEILAEDLLGRLGRVYTRRGGRFETPAFLPVINPVSQLIPAKWMREELGAEVVITNAYILYRRMREEAVSRGVHRVLGFDGIIMTDSGGYQVLEYGGVEAAPEDIAVFEEEIEADIAVPLDIPTGLIGRKEAEETVEKTLTNLEKTLLLLKSRKEKKALWVGPIQGGVHIDLLSESAGKVREMRFDLYALGSPTPLMENYRFDKLFEMLGAVKPIIGFGKPLHLFGAGHPMIFSFIVALGADMFDSASYYLYARDGRYITSTGTYRVEKLDYLPCSCPICSKTSPEELREMPREELVEKLAKHNLYACFREIREVRQAVRDGRLMELLELRAKSHPSLYQAFKRLMENDGILELMERHTPISFRRGISLYNKISLRRPIVRRSMERLLENYYKERREENILLLPATFMAGWEKIEKIAAERFGEERFEALYYGSPYGLIPYSLRYTYPFSQTEYPKKIIEECEEELIELVKRQLQNRKPRRVFLVEPRSRYLKRFAERVAGILVEKGVEVSSGN